MAYESPQWVHTFVASADLSAHQFKFVKLHTVAGQIAAIGAAADKPIGVLLNKPSAAGQTAEVGILGIFKVQGDADLAVGDIIGPSADGQADAKVKTDAEYVVGVVLEENSAAGGLTSCLINCTAPHCGTGVSAP